MFGRLGPTMLKPPTLAKPKILKPRKPHVPKMPTSAGEHQQSLAGPYHALLDPPASETAAPSSDASGAS